MTDDTSGPQLRADARRSRSLLLDAAAAAFASEESPTFKDIAKAAGVGIGTLYRHFPTREALVEAVYRAELDQLCTSTADLLATLPADQALRAWMGRWSEFVATKRGMADTFRNLAASGAVTKSETSALLTEAIHSILQAGKADSTIRGDVHAEDVTAALAGTLLVAGDLAQHDQARRLLDLLMDGLTAPVRAPFPAHDAPD